MTHSAIVVENLKVRRGSHLVLDNVSFSVPEGGITGLLGPSGSGKTTLMRSLVGVQIVEGGRVSVLGREAGSVELRNQIGYVTQSPSVYPDLTVLENVRYFASLYGIKGAAIAETIASVGLTGQSTQLVRTLSGGQRSRASLACALVAKPSLLILDEPTVGQDPVLRDELWHMFRNLADSGITILVSSHVMDEATRCDRLILIRDGGIIADDTPDAIRKRAGTDDLDQAFLTLIRSMEAAS